MTDLQFDAFLAMLGGIRVALLGIVDAIEVLLIANGKLKERTSEMRRHLRLQAKSDIMEATEQ